MRHLTVPGPLYGQAVTISDLDIYWRGNTAFEAITALLLRRQAGVGSYESIVRNVGASNGCKYTVEPDGSNLHYDTTSNNVLTANSGILRLTLELSLSSNSARIQIGGVRLTLDHDPAASPHLLRDGVTGGRRWGRLAAASPCQGSAAPQITPPRGFRSGSRPCGTMTARCKLFAAPGGPSSVGGAPAEIGPAPGMAGHRPLQLALVLQQVVRPNLWLFRDVWWALG